MSHLILPAVTLISLVTGFTGSRVTSAMVSAAEAGQAPAAISAKVLLPAARCEAWLVREHRQCRNRTTDPSSFCWRHRQAGQVASSWRR